MQYQGHKPLQPRSLWAPSPSAQAPHPWGPRGAEGWVCARRVRSGRSCRLSRAAACPQVEVWLNRVLGSMRATLRSLIPEALATYEEKAREQWVFDYPAQVGAAARAGALAPCGALGDAAFPFVAMFCPCGLLQVALTCTQIWWTTEVGMAFSKLEEGYENAIKDYNKKQVGVPRSHSPSAPTWCGPGWGSPEMAKDEAILLLVSFAPQITQLNTLISLLIGNLSAGDRMKIMTICTIDVHARDVVAKMILAKVSITGQDCYCFVSRYF